MTMTIELIWCSGKSWTKNGLCLHPNSITGLLGDILFLDLQILPDPQDWPLVM